MRDSQSPDHHTAYTSAPHYPPTRRSERNLYDTTAPQYHASAQSIPPSYPLDLSYSAHTLSATSSPQPSGSYLDTFPGMSMPGVMDMSLAQAPMGGIDLGILGADEHRDLRMLEGRARRPVPTRSEPDMLHDGGNGGERKRHQQRAHSDDSVDNIAASGRQGGPKKQRGRPRLDPKDENAADRRRTQIRLAQRAYRLRKETTISSLRTRVTDLEGAVETMQGAFLELHASAMDCIQELDDRSQQETYSDVLRSISERFLAAAKNALGPDNGESLGDDDTGDDNSRHGERPRSRDDGGPTSGGPSNNSNSVPVWGGYHITYSRETPQETYGSSAPQGESTSSSRSPYEPPPSIQDQPLDFPFNGCNLFPSIRQEMEPVSYSFQESSFSRRLHRACLENAYHLLTSPSANQHEVSKTFAYTFCYASREEIISTIVRLLRTGANDSLAPSDYPDTPLYNIPNRGDAEDDDDDQEMTCDDDNSGNGNDGNSNSSSSSSNNNDNISSGFNRAIEGHKQLLRLGITSKFLKPADVEQRLVEKGVLVEIDASSGSDHGSSPASSHGHDQGYHSSSNGSADSGNNSFAKASFTSTRGDNGKANASSARGGCCGVEEEGMRSSSFSGTGTGTRSGPVIEGVKRLVDMDILVKELIKRGVCLGQYPGFKVSDVDDCISIASRQQPLQTAVF